MKKPPAARSQRPIYRTPLGVTYIPAGPRLVVSFRECVLHMMHDGRNFRPSGIYHRGADTVFPFHDTEIGRWDFSEPQRAFIAAMMLGRRGEGPVEGFAA